MIFFISCSSTKYVTSQNDDVYATSRQSTIVVSVDSAYPDTTQYYNEQLGYGTSYNPEINLYCNVIDPDPFYISIYSPYYMGWGIYNPYPHYYYGYGWYNPYYYGGYWSPYYGGYYGYYSNYGAHYNSYMGRHRYDNYGHRNYNKNDFFKNKNNIQITKYVSRNQNIKTQPKYNRNVQSYSSPIYRQPKSSQEYNNSNLKSNTTTRQGNYVTPTGNRNYVTPTGQSTRQGNYVTPTGQSTRQGNYVTPTRNRNYVTPTSKNRTNNYSQPSQPLRQISPSRSYPSYSPSRSSSGSGGGGTRSGGGGRR